MKTIDITPTWAAILPLLLAAYEDGTPEGRRTARGELGRMAAAADQAIVDEKERADAEARAALPKGEPVAWRWRSNFGVGWMPWANGPAPDDTNATPEAKEFWRNHERQEIAAAPPAGDER